MEIAFWLINNAPRPSKVRRAFIKTSTTMETTTLTGATAPTTSKLSLVKAAQLETQAAVTSQRVALIETIQEHESIGGHDDIEGSLSAVVKHFPDGVPVTLLQSVFPDTALVTAREALKKAGTIAVEGKKGKVMIKLVAVESGNH